MQPELDDIRTRRLAAGSVLKVRDAAGHTVICCAGTVWITQENDPRDMYLSAGESFTLDRPGVAVISAEQGMRNEWMDDTGITVIALSEHLVARREKIRTAKITKGAGEKNSSTAKDATHTKEGRQFQR